jgi:hypothetical protein
MKISQIALYALIASLCLLVSCKDNHQNNQVAQPSRQNEIESLRSSIPKESVLSTDVHFYGDSIFPGHSILMAALINRYNVDTCLPIVQKRKDVREEFEGYKVLGDLNNDNVIDSVFVLEPLNWCESNDGDSYYLTDTTLPRLVSGSECCHPANFFKAPDIDEDGICEVGYFFSSCASRYKSLRFFTLRDGQWKQIATSEFDILTQDPTDVKYESLVQKISRNEFRVKNFYDHETYWDTLYLK